MARKHVYLDQESKGGGKRFKMGELSIEEQFEEFLEECTKEDAQKKTDKDLTEDKKEVDEKKGEKTPTKEEEKDREKISVDESKDFDVEDIEREEPAKETKPQHLERLEEEGKETDLPDAPKEEKPAEKSAANPFIISEVKGDSQSFESDTPFPVFRENGEDMVGARKEDSISKGENEGKATTEKTESLDGERRVNDEKLNTPFPVFNKERAGAVNTPEKPIEKPTEKPIDKIDEKLFENIVIPTKEKNVGNQMYVSEENKARIALNVTMSDAQIHSIVQQLIQSADMVVEQETTAWREKISVGEESKGPQNAPKNAPVPKNDGKVVQGPKK